MSTQILKSLPAFTLLGCALLSGAAPTTGANSPASAKDLVLNVAALDAKGQPVTDLTSADFQIFEDGKLQPISSFKANANARPAPATLILLDLLNSTPGHREFLSTLIDQALEALGPGDSVYLYVLANDGSLIHVHAVSQPRADDGLWTKRIHSLMDQAMQKAYGARPRDDKDGGIRAATTFRTLDELENRLSKVEGPKTMLWITAGSPTWLRYPYGCKDVSFPQGSGSYVAAKCTSDFTKFLQGQTLDYTPFLQHFSAKMEQDDMVLNSVEVTRDGTLPPADPGTAKDTLIKLSGLTGGRLYTGGEVVRAIGESLQGNHARYQLALESASADGKYHKLRVVCLRKGVRVETQRGYFAAPTP
jgi:VWFA-related protein